MKFKVPPLLKFTVAAALFVGHPGHAGETLPLQRKPLLGVPAPAIPELEFAATTTHFVPVLVAPNGSLPASDFQVVTTGGTAPIRFSIAGANASLFQFVTANTGIQVTQSQAQAAGQLLEARINPQSAGVQTRVIRFIGRTPAKTVPTAISAMIIATDALGKSATMEIPVHPYAPRVAPVSFNRTANQTSQFRLTVLGLGAASVARLEKVGSACNYSENPRIVYPAQSVQGGSVTFARTASFRSAIDTCSGLTATLSVRFPGSADFGAPVTVSVPPFGFAPRQRYVFEDTWELRNLFSFSLAAGHIGTCGGNSLGFNGTHAVGIVQSSNDIAFKIRSGPLGTECDFTSAAKRLPDGFVLAELDFVRTEGPNDSPTNVTMMEPRRYCGIGGYGGTAGAPVKFDFSRGKHVLASVDNADVRESEFVLEGWDRPLSTPDDVTFDVGSDLNYAVMLQPWYLKLKCVITPSNSEFITVRLNRVVFTGPPGVSFP